MLSYWVNLSNNETMTLPNLMTTTDLSNEATAEKGGFLFTTFRDENTWLSEQIYLGISKDGRRWNTLEGGNLRQ